MKMLRNWVVGCHGQLFSYPKHKWYNLKKKRNTLNADLDLRLSLAVKEKIGTTNQGQGSHCIRKNVK